MSSMRKLKRQQQRVNGELLCKKAVAKKMGITVPELNQKMRDKERKLKAMEEGYDE